jgi:plastocyanin
MRTIFTFKTFRYFALPFVLAYISSNLNGQTSHNVSVANFAFSPNNLTITAGDEVVWKNNGGSHNVNGSKSDFPSNPVSFGNSVGSGWTFSFVFNTAGTYDYQCDPHAGMGMVGRIVVSPKVTTGTGTLSDSGRLENIVLFPNPANEYINLKIPSAYSTIRSLKVYSLTGALIDQKAFSGTDETFRYDVSRFNNGVYFMEINSGTRKDVLKFVKQ